MFMVSAAWNDFPQSIIQASWRKLLKSSNSDGKRSTDGQGNYDSASRAGLQSGQTDATTQENTASGSADQPEQADFPQVQDFLQSLKQVHGCSDCDEADIEEWIQLDYDDQGYRLLNDEQIIATQNENNNNSDEDDNDEIESTISVPFHGEVHTMLVKCLPWIER